MSIYDNHLVLAWHAYIECGIPIEQSILSYAMREAQHALIAECIATKRLRDTLSPSGLDGDFLLD